MYNGMFICIKIRKFYTRSSYRPTCRFKPKRHVYLYKDAHLIYIGDGHVNMPFYTKKSASGFAPGSALLQKMLDKDRNKNHMDPLPILDVDA